MNTPLDPAKEPPLFSTERSARSRSGVVAAAFAAALLLTPRPAAAADRCTIDYSLEGTLAVTDTQFGKGNVVVPTAGSLVVEFAADDEGRVVDGKVKVLHYAMKVRFEVDSLITVTTTLHQFAPTCNGVREPTWRRESDPGFPRTCGYTGNKRAVAVGKLDIAAGEISWAKCKAAPTYWGSGRDSYTLASTSRGKGCLNDVRAVGNIHCDGRLACKWGGLSTGDNPESIDWNQPLVYGPPGNDAQLTVSADLRTIKTPRNSGFGAHSYNLPNDSPSRTWISFVASRNEQSRHTTCEQQ